MSRPSSTPIRLLGVAVLLVAGCLAFGASTNGGQQQAIQVEGFDSGTRVVREIAEALTGEGTSILGCYPQGSGLFLGLVSRLPQKARIAIVEWGMRLSVGHDPAEAEHLNVRSLVQWCVDQYPAGHRYDAVVVGSPNGAVAHLAALVRAPFLTTSFGLTFRHPTISPDDLSAYLRSSRPLIETIRRINEEIDVEIVSHYDPLHDRSLVKYADFLRIKLRELPADYQAFILQHLAPEGRLILIDCSYSWPQYVLGDRAFLQVGGLGGIPSRAFQERWPLELPIQVRRESEWGCPEEFAASVKAFAADHDIDMVEISYDRLQDYSLLAYEAYLACHGVQSERLLIDCFNHQSPRTNVETGIPALWLPFNTIEGLSFVRDRLTKVTLERIYFSPLPSFSGSPDTAKLATWIDVLSQRADLELVGIDPQRFPADPLAPFRFVAQMRSLRRACRLDTPLRLDVETLRTLLARLRCTGGGVELSVE